MELLESLPKIPVEKIAEIVKDCVKNLNAISSDFYLDESDFEFAGLFEATGLQGQTALGCRDQQFRQALTLNANLLREGLEDLYLNTIYHELIHVIVNKYMIEHKVIRLAENNQFQVIDKEFFHKIEEDNGHGGLWLDYAKRVNETLDLKLPITPYCSENELSAVYDASIDEYGEPAIEIVCQDCGSNIKFLTYKAGEFSSAFMLAAMYFDTKHGYRNTMCKKCGGTLYINIRDSELINKLNKAIEIGSFELFLYRMQMDNNLVRKAQSDGTAKA